MAKIDVTDQMVNAFAITFYTAWDVATDGLKDRLRPELKKALETALAATSKDYCLVPRDLLQRMQELDAYLRSTETREGRFAELWSGIVRPIEKILNGQP
jgi:hypothetical protein